MDNNFNRIKKNTKHKSASVHIPLNPMSASSSSEIMSNRRHYFDGFRDIPTISNRGESAGSEASEAYSMYAFHACCCLRSRCYCLLRFFQELPKICVS